MRQRLLLLTRTHEHPTIAIPSETTILNLEGGRVVNINPAAAAAVAGTARAASRGGEADNQATETTRQQAKVESPAGGTGESTVHAGEHTEDRDANGRQLYDIFEQSERETADHQEAPTEHRKSVNAEGVGGGLDLEA